MEMHLAVSRIVSWTGYLWLGLGAVWLGSAPFTKKTIYRQSEAGRYAHIAVFAAGLYLLFGRPSGVAWLDGPVYGVTVPIALAGLLLALVGVGFAVWARLMLGDNWSANPTLKDGHTLVRSGPYAIVRHPIYTGLLVALLGTAVERGSVRSLVALPVCVAGLWLKMLVEERIMVQWFGEEYVQYRREVRALAPFLF